MVEVTIQIKGDRELAAKMARVRAAGRVADAALVWAQAIAIEDRRRARAKGGRQFWGDQARRIRAQRHGTDGAAVLVGREGIHHHTGGDIFPSNARALTIPIADAARGKRAGEFGLGGRDLFCVQPKSGDPDTIGILGYSEDDRFHPLYVLRAFVRHDPDPWLVTEEEAGAIGRRELDSFLQRMSRA